jgi:hypothetical protein
MQTAGEEFKQVLSSPRRSAGISKTCDIETFVQGTSADCLSY